MPRPTVPETDRAEMMWGAVAGLGGMPETCRIAGVRLMLMSNVAESVSVSVTGADDSRDVRMAVGVVQLRLARGS